MEDLYVLGKDLVTHYLIIFLLELPQINFK